MHLMNRGGNLSFPPRPIATAPGHRAQPARITTTKKERSIANECNGRGHEAVHRHDFRHLVHIGGDHRHVPPAPQKVIPGSPYGKRCGACQSDPRDALRRPSPRRLPLRPLRPRPRGRCEVPRRPYRSRIARRRVGDEQPPDPMRRLQLRQGKPLPGITGERMTAIQELYTNNRKLSSLEKR